MEPELKELCDKLRAEIESTKKMVRSLMDHSDLQQGQSYPGQFSEMKANIMLSFRHLEDARMRIGKVLQAQSGGVSIYDKQ